MLILKRVILISKVRNYFNLYIGSTLIHDCLVHRQSKVIGVGGVEFFVCIFFLTPSSLQDFF